MLGWGQGGGQGLVGGAGRLGWQVALLLALLLLLLLSDHFRIKGIRCIWMKQVLPVLLFSERNIGFLFRLLVQQEDLENFSSTIIGENQEVR